jgi:heme exporter protein CcmD
MNLRDFVSMSGYGAYVWSCYALTFACVIWLWWSGNRQLEQQIVTATRRSEIQKMEAGS